ncbi:hypothetical protein TVAG_275850 [Trichomonas vaginalis G3]|uniref:RRM domain-containing protein n=1 Tax=Trichomonas vaginalis (strain ATCC PRA-98 / G3) TaxID=412133 RepID=A2EYF8_TRIV3|nr:RNA-binding domain, RBD family-containing protein [Trichomonas vaginalis G3]EAY02311.1 hypothetical protein TVAG_275850 [Trichomonas vaginalis G3]KAI5500893.1 RNA-binding domain, RBD family-containing protein [Trichomonas vaginalis G3]|eukprot:XP_001314626.1 hypothetical protein [Trichomonas vaginalis G3]
MSEINNPNINNNVSDTENDQNMNIDAKENEEISNEQKRSLSANFGPINNSTVEEFRNFFTEQGLQFSEISFLSHCGLIRFETQAEVDAFVKKYAGTLYKGVPLWARPPNNTKPTNYVKTLHIAGIDEAHLSERDLYRLVAPHGFVRRISTRKQFTFIEFDTTKDAKDAFHFLKSVEQNYHGLRVSYARSEQKFDASNLSIPLSEVLPENHQFWQKLQKMIYDH